LNQEKNKTDSLNLESDKKLTVNYLILSHLLQHIEFLYHHFFWYNSGVF